MTSELNKVLTFLEWTACMFFNLGSFLRLPGANKGADQVEYFLLFSSFLSIGSESKLAEEWSNDQRSMYAWEGKEQDK